MRARFCYPPRQPTPFCVLDEVDATLDEANVDRLRSALEMLSDQTQFIVITHNRRTLEMANSIYALPWGMTVLVGLLAYAWKVAS